MDNIVNQTPPPQSPKGSSGWIVGILVLVILLGGFLWWRSQGSTSDESQETNQNVDLDNDGDEGAMPTVTPTPSVTTSPTPTGATVSPTPTPTGTTSGTVKTFTVEGSSFKFSPSQITVNKGDTVKIVFNNTGGMHDFVIDEFNVKTSRISGGQSETVQFVADKTGTFEYYCSVGTHRQMGMVGKLVVQ